MQKQNKTSVYLVVILLEAANFNEYRLRRMPTIRKIEVNRKID